MARGTRNSTGEGVETPEGWARASDPLRIAILGWARLSLQAREGSGYNLNASELASGLALSGHEVSYLRSGLDYALWPRGPFVRESASWRGVRCYSLVNSRNLSPASTNFRNLGDERSSPRDSEAVLAWVERVRAQVVHVHSLEGFPLDLIAALRARGLPVVVTPHNYWYACPQVDLLHRERECCLDYEGGRRCKGCLDAPSPAKARRNRAIQQMLESVFGFELVAAGKQSLKAFRERRRDPSFRAILPGDVPGPDPEVARGFDARESAGSRGEVEHGLRVLARDKVEELGRAPSDANERFLSSREVHLRVLHPYGERRAAGLAALASASLVTPPSAFMARAYEAMGVPREKLRLVRLGQPHFDQINRRARRSPFYETRPWEPGSARRPLRVGFWGTTRNNKGLGVLARAIEVLDPALRRRAQFIIHASGGDWGYRKMLSRFPEVSFLGAYDPLMLLAGGGEYDVAVLPHIWFENSPLVMLEHLHAGKYILCSRLGGPVDWIQEPGSPGGPGNSGLGNGLFFPAGDWNALASALHRVIAGEVTLPSPREVHEVSELRSYPDHVVEVGAIYRELLGARPEVDVVTRVAAPAGA